MNNDNNNNNALSFLQNPSFLFSCRENACNMIKFSNPVKKVLYGSVDFSALALV
jgi:hypothetical protein